MMDALVQKPVMRAPGHANLGDAVRVWTQVSIAGIGGPALQLATMHRLVVQRKRWISEERFFHAFSYCIALPGPETQQLAIYIGWLAHRTLGGIIAGSLFILPGVICMMALCFGYVTGAESPIGQAIFIGIRPAILAVMVDAILRFGRHVIHSRSMAALAGAAFLAAFFKLPFTLVVLAAALLGLCTALAGLPGLARPVAGSIDKLTQTHEYLELPDHTRPSLTQFLVSLTIWLALWLIPPIALLAIFGLENVYTQISLLIGKVAVMAVGGDYAVVAYATEQVVHSYHWISGREMQEGIAMGEMVPGTIMIVTQFLGFIAAYRDAGALPPLVAGVFGGLLATWMTFCPCFLWIMLLAPFIEGLRRNTLLNSTLQAVTAAAVGMILNLSVWFGIRALFHDIERVRFSQFGFDIPVFTSMNLWALALFICAAVAVLRFKASAAATLLVSSGVGILLLCFGLTG